MARKLYGAIVWQDHGVDNRFLALEKRGGKAVYLGDSWVTFLTSANLQPLTDADVETMRNRAKELEITLTTDEVTTRRYK